MVGHFTLALKTIFRYMLKAVSVERRKVYILCVLYAYMYVQVCTYVLHFHVLYVHMYGKVHTVHTHVCMYVRVCTDTYVRTVNVCTYVRMYA